MHIHFPESRQGTTGLYLVLLGFTGFYWVLLSFTWCDSLLDAGCFFGHLMRHNENSRYAHWIKIEFLR